MTVEFILLVNKQGQTRLSEYRRFMAIEERVCLEGEVVRKCLQRRETDCNFLDHFHYKVVYRRYASLFFIVGLQNAASLVASRSNGPADFGGCDNELATLEFIQAIVETLDRYFQNVCELDVLFNIEKVHFILQEMLSNGMAADTNSLSALQPITLMDVKTV